MSERSIHSKEEAFHDEWAESTPVGEVRVRECFEAPAALENRYIIRSMGSLDGKKVLDIGSGLGESSVYFALRGAKVTMIDISPGMIEKAKQVGLHHGVTLEGFATAGEVLPVGDNQFDIVYVANVIHHVTDRRALIEGIRRVLKPGGRFFASEPLIYNPVVNVYRKIATEVRTEDERPLTYSEVSMVGEYFDDFHCRMFWIATLALFLKYYLFDRIHPNSDRYWKRILKETDSSLWWWKPLLAVDAVLTRIPGLKWLSWTMVMTGRKPLAKTQ